MKIEGRRIRRTRYIQTDNLVVAVEVDMVYPVDDPDEPCYESEVVAFLKEVKNRAEQADYDWLKTRGKVYSLVAA